LAAEKARAHLFRTLATLRTDLPLFESVDSLQWTGPTAAFAALAAQLDANARGDVGSLARRVPQ
ncbi:MAG: flap endonuclease, partial [Vicinamibacterales bacterium]